MNLSTEYTYSYKLKVENSTCLKYFFQKDNLDISSDLDDFFECLLELAIFWVLSGFMKSAINNLSLVKSELLTILASRTQVKINDMG